MSDSCTSVKRNGKQDVFEKHECPHNSYYLVNKTLIFDHDLDLSSKEKVIPQEIHMM